MNLDPKILYEEESVLVINKPAGLMVHGDGRSKEKTLADWLLEKYPEMKDTGEPWEHPETGVVIPRPGIVHRLDKETSGVMVVAKNQETFLYLKKQFQERKIKKGYKAIVWGWVKEDEGIIDKPIGRSKKDFRMWSAQRGARGIMREAVTQFKVLNRFEQKEEKFSYIEVYPKTGRTHQIRVHLKYLNHPVVCDTLYAAKRACPLLGFSRLALHAFSIEFSLSDGSIKKIEAPLSDDFEQTLAEVSEL